jgi:hypothetical protein
MDVLPVGLECGGLRRFHSERSVARSGLRPGEKAAKTAAFQTHSDLTCIAVDWSGALVGAHRRIWLAEARAGQLIRLENGRTAAELALELIETSARITPLVVGLDFAFSFPAWFFDNHSLSSAPDLWRLAARQGENWLSECQPPFWGRPGRKRPTDDLERGYRRGELELSHRPKSVFQIGGSGAVGTGSIRGMPALLQLQEAGFSIWPYDKPSFPMALEVYPRLLTGPVNKSDPLERLALLRERYSNLDSNWITLAAGTDDAFDAAVSAIVMSEHASSFGALPDCQDPQVRKEGCIWHPAMSVDYLAALTRTPSAP